MPVKKFQSKSKKSGTSNSVKVLDDADENENQIDEFDFELSIDYYQVYCAMCKGDHKDGVIFTKKMEEIYKNCFKDNDDDDDDEIEDTGSNVHGVAGSPTKSKIAALSNRSPTNIKFLDPHGVWLSKHPINIGKRRVFVHYYCALCSPRCFFDGKQWKNVKKEVMRSGSLACYACQKKGATIKCKDKKCPAVFHIPCALNIGLKTDFNNNYIKFTCPEHLQIKQITSQELEALSDQDISRGRECIPIKVHNDIDDELLCKPCSSLITGDCGTNFSYISVNLDSDNVIATSQAVTNIDCCHCIGGLCNNVDTCACLNGQRNYTNQGTLISGLKSPIYECNMRCSCNVRRCTNRIVTQGIKYGLEVFRGDLGSISSTHAEVDPNHKKPRLSSSRYWGLRTTQQAIATGGLICEVKGQYVLGGSILYKGQAKCSQSISVSQEFIRQLQSVADFSSDSLTVFPSLLWELPVLTMKSVIDFAELNYTDTNREFNSEVPLVEKFLDEQVFLDTRHFSNIFRFIRQIYIISLDVDDTKCLLTRRIVHDDQAADRRHPKLAIFARVDISAGTELVL